MKGGNLVFHNLRLMTITVTTISASRITTTNFFPAQTLHNIRSPCITLLRMAPQSQVWGTLLLPFFSLNNSYYVDSVYMQQICYVVLISSQARTFHLPLICLKRLILHGSFEGKLPIAHIPCWSGSECARHSYPSPLGSAENIWRETCAGSWKPQVICVCHYR